ncbi:WcaI family glycosyltransferase [Chitinophaga nivalis]|uniref:WcaI family glycosyltransferase n=1 Tax=Chitinophaga nivalis TaxID=2991709 RepID=A0ABT3IEP8_9BACT|nr:WcaI family glycosyltransferase [Chitinophaga nivalis]MCW3467880.1 WcaI family glycosyltransferase [Chitinophaga nivalis]MCW3482429.1 WcaI family glycosyltransferase [Chitinophaga nivalis]
MKMLSDTIIQPPPRPRILLISCNYAPEPNGTGKYNGEMINWLAANGYDCTVITTCPYYPEWKVQPPYDKNKYRYRKEAAGDHVTIYRCPQYVPTKPSGKMRMLQDFSFTLSAGWKLIQLLTRSRFDIVITVVPSFHLGLLAVLYKKLRHARFLYHIQDMQIEAARDLQMIRSRWLLSRLFRIEQYIFRQADTITSISDGMIRKIQQKAGKPIQLLPNWVDIQRYHPLDDRDTLKKAYGFHTTDKVVLYSGAIGEKQGLEAILHAARALREQAQLKFLICGSGPYQARLHALAHSWQLNNISFLPLQPAAHFNRFLNMADVHLVIQKGHAADLVMPSKLTTIMAVGGLALITANEGTSLHTLVQQHEIGMLVKADDQQQLNEGILRAVHTPPPHIARNARRYAENHLSVEKIMSDFTSLIQQS